MEKEQYMQIEEWLLVAQNGLDVIRVNSNFLVDYPDNAEMFKFMQDGLQYLTNACLELGNVINK